MAKILGSLGLFFVPPSVCARRLFGKLQSMSIQAKKTEYRGVCFRSRSEARLAVCFDAAGWRWEYEPKELDVNGWKPDFLVVRKNRRPIVVEYKPARPSDEYINELTQRFEVLNREYTGRTQCFCDPLFVLCVHDFFNLQNNIDGDYVFMQEFMPCWEHLDEKGDWHIHGAGFEDFFTLCGSAGTLYRFDLRNGGTK